MRILLLLLACFSSPIVAKTLPATNFQATHDFINRMVKNHQFNKDELLFIFSKIELTLADKNQKTKKPKNQKTMSWDKYKGLFITEQRIKDGINFWQDNLTTLKCAESKYNVPAEIIVAILGIETNYGNKKGTHPTLETLAKRAFGNYRRKKFYQKELKEFLLMSRENVIPPLSIQGSYAGAMGYPQFIASSYRYYAVDFNHDGKIDLFSNPIDAIGSIANYFDQHQWHDGGEFARPITLQLNHLKHARLSTNKPKKNTQYWRNKGLDIHQDIKNKTKLAFISLPQDEINETWLTFWNFYVLTRYNHDNRYAMAAYQLSNKLKQAFNQLNN
ncbi:MAG: Membrane-bound lytic murein transglycosylase B precursor [Candidatus Ruthia sp. Asou_11_S2]|nr:Membrane-bound lytic murein transglycosylase B precursor [Candidatus Ruthia sp. Asou_11_S2]